MSPLGVAALAGTGFPIDRAMTAMALGFANGPMKNSLDGVSDRDFALDYLMAATQIALHLSRLAEELIIWASQPFGFISLPDAYSTGSSIMPQKRNPDAAELVRGHAGRIMGCMTALCVTMKGLPLAYSKDMQDDKPPVFEAHDLLGLSITAMTGMIETTTFRTDRMRALAEVGFATATDLADWLVREAGRAVPRGASYHRARGEGRPRSRRGAGRTADRRRSRRSTRGSTSGSMPCSRLTPRSPAARAMAARRRTRGPRPHRRGAGRAGRGGQAHDARADRSALIGAAGRLRIAHRTAGRRPA